MSARWQVWQTELERLSPFSEEWNEGLPEEFIRTLSDLLAKKRAQREAVEKLAAEIRTLRATYAQTLAFFDMERVCQSWSADNCPGPDVDRVLQILEQWRGSLVRYEGMFPPVGEKVKTYAALREACLEADEAMAKIRPGFGALHDVLAPPIAAAEPAAEEKAAAAAASAETEPAPAAQPPEAEPGIVQALGQISTQGVWLASDAVGRSTSVSSGSTRMQRIGF